MRTRYFVTLLLICLSVSSEATIYYISHNGNDQNSGTSQSSPWRSIARLQQVMNTFGPGDEVYFERGGIYPGIIDISRSGSSTQPLIFGAYGSGEKPIISGGVPVTDWIQHSGNIWRASMPTAPKYVLVNNLPMTKARFPNSGFLNNEQGSASQINCAALSQGSGHWTGATVIVRTTNFSYENGTVTSSSYGQINFSGVITNLQNDDWGFFLEGKLSELDMAGEWFHDETTGQLYLWAPNDQNPNGLTVLASIYNKGVVPGYQKSHMRIENLTIQGQTHSAISTDVSYNVVVENCDIRYSYLGVSSIGADNQYINNHFHGTFASAMEVYDENVLIENNIYTDIAVRPGMGQVFWGYWGIRTTGLGAVIRGNRLNNIGYIGIAVNKNALVEDNVVINATSILNDGAGISFDNCDGVIVRDNLVLDCLGSLESVAPSHYTYYPICFGIYFGNTSIKNTTVERNTVARCNGAGIHVDHTMVSTGNQIKDNVLFDNNIQLSISDFSNYNGPGAAYPYHVPSFNTVYSGNVMYSLRKDQLCMRQYNVYSQNDVDFGVFSNNKYFNPYEEMSIMVRKTQSGTHDYYTLERWQSTFSEDAGSSRSPLRLAPYATVSELSSDLIVNGDFSDPIDNWTLFPGNAQVSIDHTYLDDGSFKANLPNNSLYDGMNLRGPDQFSIQNGQWYRMRVSLQSDIEGYMTPAVKGLSQMGSTQTLGSRDIPFSTERRDVEFYFQSQASDQAMLQFSNKFDHPRYWIDNVELHRVTVQALDPAQDHKLFYNEFTMAQEFSVPSGCWKDVAGNVVEGSFTLQPFMSKVIYRVTGDGCSTPPLAYTVGAKVMLGGALTGAGTMRTDLLSQGILPTTEPYSGMGYVLENPGEQISSSLLQATGPQAIVDWVLVELRDPNSGYSISAQRAALVRSNGEIVAINGDPMLQFSVQTQGKHLGISHRNHLGIMTQSPIGNNGDLIDLTTSATLTYGQGARMYHGAFRALWPGDVNNDDKISYTNSDNDRDPILVVIGSVVPSNTAIGYLKEDVNLDGVVKYTGTTNDRDVILTSIGGMVPTAVRLAQLP